MKPIRVLPWCVLAGCGQPDPGPCAAPTADQLDAIAVGSDFVAQQYWSSESAPFEVDDPSSAWFECPRAIAHAFERRADVPITTIGGGDGATLLAIDPGVTYQTILGIGTGMEAASVSNLMALSATARTEVLTRMFDPIRGMGMSLVRVTIGTSDFTGSPWYTYDDVEPGMRDPDLARFSIRNDFDAGIIDALRDIRTINPDVRFFASPWSPPGWMKSSDAITGGALRSSDIPIYATYLRRFVEAYGDAGIPIDALTLQNEPGTESAQYPTCLVTPQQEAMLAIALKRELAARGLATKIWIYDHNFDAALDYATAVFADGDARAASDGVAFHDYAGDPHAMTAVHDRFPDHDIV